MNSFADNPLFFFMDNISPIISMKANKDVRKIVELSDTGCDARLPAFKASRNTGRSHFPKLSKMKQNENWKSRCDENIEEKSYAERSRASNVLNAMDTEEYLFTLKEDETNQYYWQSYSPLEENPMENIEFKRKPDFRSKLRPSSDRSRPNFYKQDNSFYKMSNTVRNNPNIVLSNDIKKENLSQSNPTRPKSAGPKLRSSYPSKSLDSNLNDQMVINRERIVSAKQDYPEDFVSKDIPRNSSRNQKSHWQRMNDADHRFSRYNSKNESAANSDEVSRDWIEPPPSRIRSRTCSPPVDRQKKTRSFLKNLYENLDQTEPRQDNESQNNEYSKSINSSLRDTDSDRSVDRRFVDRAVDKDSLSDLQNVCTSAERFSKLASQVEKSNARANFWEFIPLDKSDEKYKKITGNKEIIYPHEQQVSLDNKSCPIMKSSTKNSDVRRWKDKFLQKYSKNSGSCNGPSLMKPQVTSEIDNDKRNLFAYALHNEQSSENEAKEKSNVNLDKCRVTSTNVHKNLQMVDSTKNQRQCKYEWKSQSKLASKITFGWTNKTNRCLKRGSASEDENDDKKKRTANANDTSSVTDDQKVRTNIVERTAACLKRKLDRSRIREVAASNQHSPIVVKKKIRSEGFGHSKLPIRIGDRHRSSNPMTKNQFNFKCVSREENKEMELKESNEEPCRLSSISARSRTKPKIKPSVIVGEAIDFADTSTNFQSGGFNTENKSKITDSLVNDAKAKSKSNSIGTKGNLNNEKLQIDTGSEDNTGKMLNVEGHERKRNVINREREMDYKKGLTNEMVDGTPRNGLKENCCFHLNAEQNVTYNNYCNKEHRNLGCFRSRKPTAIKTQF
ncbi:unnamed protein product [Heterotrigona itama]|uniref:Uncharacterized protein n=1 Tax=Heterotrigona itama TaxID=395501 RepID=A0A6V7H5Q5_9HYME|nr:unnamed protein product [Heterotrigona itama]